MATSPELTVTEPICEDIKAQAPQRKEAQHMAKPEFEFFPVTDVDWTPALGGVVPGLLERILASDGNSGVATRILRFDPGTDTSKAGVQIHTFWEEVYIL